MKIFSTNTNKKFIVSKHDKGKYIDNLLKQDINNSTQIIIFDFKNIIDEESFWDEIQNNFTHDCDWFGRNFDAFNDALRGNCGLFEVNEPVNVSVINIKNISPKTELYSLFIKMLDFIIRFTDKIKADDYCIKYIWDLKNTPKSIYLMEDKFISLCLYKDQII